MSQRKRKIAHQTQEDIDEMFARTRRLPLGSDARRAAVRAAQRAQRRYNEARRRV